MQHSLFALHGQASPLHAASPASFARADASQSAAGELVAGGMVGVGGMTTPVIAASAVLASGPAPCARSPFKPVQLVLTAASAKAIVALSLTLPNFPSRTIATGRCASAAS